MHFTKSIIYILFIRFFAELWWQKKDEKTFSLDIQPPVKYSTMQYNPTTSEFQAAIYSVVYHKHKYSFLPFKLCFIYFKGRIPRERSRKAERSSIHWLLTKLQWLGLRQPEGRSQGFPCSLIWVQEPKKLGNSLLLCQVHWLGATLDMEKPGHVPVCLYAMTAEQVASLHATPQCHPQQTDYFITPNCWRSLFIKRKIDMKISKNGRTLGISTTLQGEF